MRTLRIGIVAALAAVICVSQQPAASGDDEALLGSVWRGFASDKSGAEELLRHATEQAPDNRKLGAHLGFLYAMEILGIDGFHARASAAVPAEQRTRTAEHAIEQLKRSRNGAVLAGAGVAIPKLLMLANMGRMVDPKYFAMASDCTTRARQLEPNEEEFRGPLPMVRYLEEALGRYGDEPLRGPPAKSPIVAAAEEAGRREMEEMHRRFEAADLRTVRLPPRAFPDLPPKVASELDRRGCTIPQPYGETRPRNVIRGEFAKTGQTDWAVLCSVSRVSSILVFWNGSDRDPAVIAPEPDIQKLQGLGGDAIGYSRAITPVAGDYILSHFAAHGQGAPPAIDHQGIDDAFVGKASVIHYFRDGGWITLPGAD